MNSMTWENIKSMGVQIGLLAFQFSLYWLEPSDLVAFCVGVSFASTVLSAVALCRRDA